MEYPDLLREGLGYIAEPLRSLAVPIASLNLDSANARRHDDKNLAAIASSLSRWGQRFPIVVQRDGMVVRAGNGRVEAARSLGWSHIAALVVDESSVEATAFAIADNRTAELAEWDEGTLAQLLSTLPKDLQVGFDDQDLRELMARVAPELVEDEAPAVQVQAVSRTGDLWELGAHRLLCGDSTKAEDVAACLGCAAPFLMVTDPPYGVEYDGGEANDDKREALSGDDAPDLYEPACRLSPSNVLYVWFADSHALPVYSAAIKSNYEPRALLIWNKINAHYGAPAAHYKQKHEPCLYAVRRGGARWIGDMTTPTVWDIPQPHRNEFHPTQKPIECMARPIRNHDAPEVYDPFLGSGTTLIAAEQLNRRCYAIEISPNYVDVAVRRWQNLTGKSATLGGRTFADVEAERLATATVV